MNWTDKIAAAVGAFNWARYACVRYQVIISIGNGSHAPFMDAFCLELAVPCSMVLYTIICILNPILFAIEIE